MKKQERLSKARYKQEEIKEKVRVRKLNTEIENKLKQLPISERKKIEQEEERQRKIELQQMKKSLWKLRTKENKNERKSEKVEKLEQVEKMEEKLQMIKRLIQELREEEEKHEEEKREEKLLKEWRKKIEAKTRRENERKTQLEKQKLLHQRWEMMKWVTEFIKTNQDKWEKERLEKQKEIEKELEDWNRSKRFEKIEKLKQKWKKNEHTERKNDLTKPTETNKKILNKDVWRRKRERSEEKITTGCDIEENNHDQVSVQLRYDVQNLIKQPKIICPPQVTPNIQQTQGKVEITTTPPELEGREVPEAQLENLTKPSSKLEIPKKQKPTIKNIRKIFSKNLKKNHQR